MRRHRELVTGSMDPLPVAGTRQPGAEQKLLLQSTTEKRRNYMALITNLQHFLDSQGAIPENIPGPAHRLSLFLGAIVGWVTSHPVGQAERSNVPCRRRPGRRRCSGFIEAWLEPDSTIRWVCPHCQDNGIIRGWEHTLWDRCSQRH